MIFFLASLKQDGACRAPAVRVSLPSPGFGVLWGMLGGTGLCAEPSPETLPAWATCFPLPRRNKTKI